MAEVVVNWVQILQFAKNDASDTVKSLTLTKAWFVGIVVLSVPYGAFLIVGLANWFHVVDLPFLKACKTPLDIWISAGPGVAGFLTAFLAPRERFLAGVSLTVAAVVLIVVHDALSDAFGLPHDSYGLWGIAIGSIGIFIVCGLGAFFGGELSEYLENRKRRKQRT